MKLIDANLLKAQFTGGFCEAYTPAQIKAVIDTASEIDPVHAAGGVYCRECKFVQKRGYGYLFCTNGNRKYAGWCRDNDFCSRGVKREVADDADKN